MISLCQYVQYIFLLHILRTTFQIDAGIVTNDGRNDDLNSADFVVSDPESCGPRSVAATKNSCLLKWFNTALLRVRNSNFYRNTYCTMMATTFGKSNQMGIIIFPCVCQAGTIRESEVILLLFDTLHEF